MGITSRIMKTEVDLEIEGLLYDNLKALSFDHLSHEIEVHISTLQRVQYVKVVADTGSSFQLVVGYDNLSTHWVRTTEFANEIERVLREFITKHEKTTRTYDVEVIERFTQLHRVDASSPEEALRIVSENMEDHLVDGAFEYHSTQDPDTWNVQES